MAYKNKLSKLIFVHTSSFFFFHLYVIHAITMQLHAITCYCAAEHGALFTVWPVSIWFMSCQAQMYASSIKSCLMCISLEVAQVVPV